MDKQQQKWYEDSLKYEDAHLGNFRRIYPAEGSEKYDKYFQNSGSLYQETAAFKARSECARFVSQLIGVLDFYSVCDTFLHSLVNLCQHLFLKIEFENVRKFIPFQKQTLGHPPLPAKKFVEFAYNMGICVYIPPLCYDIITSYMSR